jgi:hypothetical protein
LNSYSTQQSLLPVRRVGDFEVDGQQTALEREVPGRPQIEREVAAETARVARDSPSATATGSVATSSIAVVGQPLCQVSAGVQLPALVAPAESGAEGMPLIPAARLGVVREQVLGFRPAVRCPPVERHARGASAQRELRAARAGTVGGNTDAIGLELPAAARTN